MFSRPFLVLVSFILLFSSALMVEGVVSILVFSIVFTLLLIIYRIDAGRMIIPVLRCYPFFLVIFFMNAFFQKGNAIWSFYFLTLTREGLASGISVCLHLALASFSANLLSSILRPSEVSQALRTLLFPFSYLRLPVDEVSEILSRSLVMLPRLKTDADKISKAMKARGAKGRVNLFRLSLPLAISSFRYAEDLSLALEMRGYDGTSLTNRGEKFGKKELLFLLLSVLLLIFNIIWR